MASRWMFSLMISRPFAWQIHHLVASRIISFRHWNTCLPSLKYSCANLQEFPRLCIRFLDILGQSSTSLPFNFIYIENYIYKNISLTYMEHFFHDFSSLISLSLQKLAPWNKSWGCKNYRNLTYQTWSYLKGRTFSKPKSWQTVVFSSQKFFGKKPSNFTWAYLSDEVSGFNPPTAAWVSTSRFVSPLKLNGALGFLEACETFELQRRDLDFWIRGWRERGGAGGAGRWWASLWEGKPSNPPNSPAVFLGRCGGNFYVT